jgi:hypothetical protein
MIIAVLLIGVIVFLILTILMASTNTLVKPDSIITHAEIILPLNYTYSPMGTLGTFIAEPFQLYLKNDI